MAFNKSNLTNIDNSDLANYPAGQIRDNDGSDNGTPVSRLSMSDIFEFFARLMVLSGTDYNNAYENAANGYQYVDAMLALAGKNAKLQNLTAGSEIIATVNTPILILPVKIETLQLNEIIIAKAASDFAGQTKLRGATAAIYKTIAASDAFKANDTVFVVNTNAGIVIIDLVTVANVDAKVGAASYLKAASAPEEIAGAINTKASTPAGVFASFLDRVNGASSGSFLASNAQNGLLSIADKNKIDQAATTLNVGSVQGIDVGQGSIGSTYLTTGDITQVQLKTVTANPGGSTYEVTFANAMPSTNFYVRIHIQSVGDIVVDSAIFAPVFKLIPGSTTKFTLGLSERANGTQNLTIFFEVVKVI